MMKTLKKTILKKDAIVAYKVFNIDWTCRDFQYEVGKTYQMKGEIELCARGFHACTFAGDCFYYYPFDAQCKVAQVLCWGEVQENKDDSKICCSKIFIEKELSWYDVLNLCNIGEDNTGFSNVGIGNTNNRNVGSYNTGTHNHGRKNTGPYNFGNHNTGSGNIGSMNTGDYNHGHNNTGLYNFGNYNSGSYNSGNGESGWFNTKDQRMMFCFNRPAKKQLLDIPRFLYVTFTRWVDYSNMTKKEKEKNPTAKYTGGYLKKLEYKEAIRESFMDAKKEEDWEKEFSKLKALPNFDYDIFEEITGLSREDLNS